MDRVHRRIEPLFKNIPLEIAGGLIALSFAVFLLTAHDAVPGDVAFVAERGLEEVKVRILQDDDRYRYRLQLLKERIEEYEYIAVQETWGNAEYALIQIQQALDEVMYELEQEKDDEGLQDPQFLALQSRVEVLKKYHAREDAVYNESPQQVEQKQTSPHDFFLQ